MTTGALATSTVRLPSASTETARRADDRGRFALLDDGGTDEGRARAEPVAVVDRQRRSCRPARACRPGACPCARHSASPAPRCGRETQIGARTGGDDAPGDRFHRAPAGRAGRRGGGTRVSNASRSAGTPAGGERSRRQRHAHLVPLADVAHLGGAAMSDVAAAHTGRAPAGPFLLLPSRR